MNQPDCGGVVWQNISVVGYGAVVYVGDRKGKLWKSTDGGDGMLDEHQLAPQLAVAHAPFVGGSDTLIGALCDTSLLVVTYQNIGCSYASLQRVAINGLDSSEYIERSTHHRSCERTPDTPVFVIRPQRPGIHNLIVHTIFVDNEYHTIDSTIPVTFNVKPESAYSVDLNVYVKSKRISVSPGDILQVPVYVGKPSQSVMLHGRTVIDIPFVAGPHNVVPLDFRTALPGVTANSLTTNSNGTINVELNASDGLSYTGETVIGTLRCGVYLEDTMNASVSLAGITAASTDGRCIRLESTDDTVRIDIKGCGDSTLLSYLRSGAVPYSIEHIVPNPARQTVHVLLHNPFSEPLSCELIDACGVLRIHTTLASDRIDLDVHTLPSGIYYLRIAGPNGRCPHSQTVLIER